MTAKFAPITAQKTMKTDTAESELIGTVCG